MTLLSYGIGNGLAYQHDFNADINRAQNNELLDQQARINAENKAAILGERLKAKHLATTWDNLELKKYAEGKVRELGNFVSQNPDYAMNPPLQAKYQELLDSIDDNEYVQNSMNANSNYQALTKYIQENPGSENDPQVQQQLQAYDNYNKTGSADGVTANRKMYVFSAPDKFDPTVSIGNVYSKLKPTETYVGGHGLGATETKVPDTVLKATAASMLTGPDSFRYKAAWQNMSESQKTFYNNDPVEWIAMVGKGYTGSSVSAGTYFAPKSSGSGDGGGGKGGADVWSAWQHDYYRMQQSNAPTYLQNIDKALPLIDGKIQIEGDLKVPTTDANGNVTYVSVPGYTGQVVEATPLKRTQVIDGIPYTQVQVKVPMSAALVVGDKPLFKDTSWMGTWKGGDVEEIDSYKPVAQFARDKDGKIITDDDDNPYALVTTYVRVPTDPVAQRNYDSAETGTALTNKGEGIRQQGFDVDVATTMATAMGLDASRLQYSPSAGKYYAPNPQGQLVEVTAQ